jgi:hypothetical protein
MGDEQAATRRHFLPFSVIPLVHSPPHLRPLPPNSFSIMNGFADKKLTHLQWKTNLLVYVLIQDHAILRPSLAGQKGSIDVTDIQLM